MRQAHIWLVIECIAAQLLAVRFPQQGISTLTQQCPGPWDCPCAPASQQTGHPQTRCRQGGSRPPRIARRPRPAAAACMATRAGGSGLEVSSAFCRHAVACSEIKRCPPPCCRPIQLAVPAWHATSTSQRPRLAGSRAAPGRALPEPGPQLQLRGRHPVPSCSASGQAMRSVACEAELRLGCSSHSGVLAVLVHIPRGCRCLMRLQPPFYASRQPLPACLHSGARLKNSLVQAVSSACGEWRVR